MMAQMELQKQELTAKTLESLETAVKAAHHLQAHEKELQNVWNFYACLFVPRPLCNEGICALLQLAQQLATQKKLSETTTHVFEAAMKNQEQANRNDVDKVIISPILGLIPNNDFVYHSMIFTADTTTDSAEGRIIVKD